MTDHAAFDRLLSDSLMTGGPDRAPARTLTLALAAAAQIDQRRSRIAVLDRQAWPVHGSIADPSLVRAGRLVIVALLTAALIATSIYVGSLLVRPAPGGSSWLAVVSNAQSHCMHVDRVPITSGQTERIVDCSGWVSLSTDGRRAAAIRPDEAGTGVILDVYDLQTGMRQEIAHAGGRGIVPWGFSEGGRYALWYWCTSATFPSECADAAMAGLDDAAQGPTDLPGDALEVHWSPDDARMAINTNDGILLGAGDGSGFVTTGLREFLAWSPDGLRFVHRADGDLFVADADGSNSARIGDFQDPRLTAAAWSPDGQTLAVIASEPAGRFSDQPWPIPELWLVEADGSRQRRADVGPLCSRSTPASGPDASARLDCTGAIGPHPGYGIAWSPDSAKVAVSLTDGSDAEPVDTAIVDVASLDVVRIAGGSKPAWSPDGRHVVLVAASGVETVRADGSDRHQILASDEMASGSAAWVPD